MESNNINRLSVTGLKSIEINELNTPQIIINNEGLQYFHKYTKNNTICITNQMWVCHQVVLRLLQMRRKRAFITDWQPRAGRRER